MMQYPGYENSVYKVDIIVGHFQNSKCEYRNCKTFKKKHLRRFCHWNNDQIRCKCYNIYLCTCGLIFKEKCGDIDFCTCDPYYVWNDLITKCNIHNKDNGIQYFNKDFPIWNESDFISIFGSTFASTFKSIFSYSNSDFLEVQNDSNFTRKKTKLKDSYQIDEQLCPYDKKLIHDMINYKVPTIGRLF